jgi:hypothetical protein
MAATPKREIGPDGIDHSYDLPIHEATEEEWWAIIDCLARQYFDMSGAEFAEAWAARKIEDPDRSDVLAIAMMLPNYERRPE